MNEAALARPKGPTNVRLLAGSQGEGGVFSASASRNFLTLLLVEVTTATLDSHRVHLHACKIY